VSVIPRGIINMPRSPLVEQAEDNPNRDAANNHDQKTEAGRFE
jgi:hypothetical protein